MTISIIYVLKELKRPATLNTPRQTGSYVSLIITCSADTLCAAAADRGVGNEDLVTIAIRLSLRHTVHGAVVHVRALELGGRH